VNPSIPQTRFKGFKDHLCRQLIPHLPQSGAALECLDFLCHDGSICLEIFNELGDGSRVIAMDTSRESLSRFHEKLSHQPANIFLRKQSIQSHPFGESVFDLAWGLWAFSRPEDLSRVLRNIYPILKPGASLLCALPLHGSFSELYRFMQEAQDPQQDSSVFASREEFPSVSACQKSVEDAGLTWQTSTQSSFEFVTEGPILKDTFLMRDLFPLWTGNSTAVSTMFEQALTLHQVSHLNVSVNLGVFCATRT